MIGPELNLAISCCRSAFATGATPLVPGALPAIDWPRLLRIARFHRVQGLASLALGHRPGVPDDVAEALAMDASDIAGANLRKTAEAGRLLDAFARAGVDLLFLKGLPLGALVYRNPLLKAATDVDILVRDGDLGRAAELLGRLGYRRLHPTTGDLSKWHARRKESVWSTADVQLDLHTRLSDNPRLIPTIGVQSPRQAVEVAAGITLPSLADDELFAYLAVHGASSAWFRLKWIADFAGFLSGRAPAEIEHLYRRSEELGAGRASAQALLVADHFFGSLEGTPLKARLLDDRPTRWLARAAARQVAGRAEPREPTAVPLGTWRIHWTQLLLKRGLAFKLSELSRQLSDAIA